MQIIKNKERIGNFLFLLAIIIEAVIMMTDHSAITLPYRGRVAQLAFILFGCKILTTMYTWKQWIAIIVSAILGSISYFTCGDEYVIRVMVMVFASKNIDVKQIVKIIFSITEVGTAIIIILSLMEILGQAVDIRHYGRGVEEVRWCLGFNHANNVHCIFWYLTAMYLFLYHERCKAIHFTVLTVANLLIFGLTVSRTGIIATQILIIGVALIRYIPQLNKMILAYILSAFGVIGCFILTLMGAKYGWNNSFIKFVDGFLTGRMEMSFENARLNTWMIFPTGETCQLVDNGFAKLFFDYGIVIGIVYLLVLFMLIWILYCRDKGTEVVILITTVFVTFMEATFVFNTSLLCNFILILLFNQWWVTRKKGKIHEVKEYESV